MLIRTNAEEINSRLEECRGALEGKALRFVWVKQNTFSMIFEKGNMGQIAIGK